MKRKTEFQRATGAAGHERSAIATPVTIRLPQCEGGYDGLSHAPRFAGATAAQAGAEQAAAPMRWSGANAQGNVVFGVAASTAELGQVEILAIATTQAGSYNAARRGLSPHQSRQLARHLMAAADEAERREALQLVATA